MTRQPVPIHERLPATIKAHITALKLHTQQITTLQSQAAATTALVPGDWEAILLTGGWSNLAGYIPAQVRIQQSGMSMLIGHITGGTTANGTVIGTLTSGFFNTVHAHAFAANAVTGAAAVAHAGAVSNPAVSTGALADIAGDLNSGGSNVTPSTLAGVTGGTLADVVAYANALGQIVNNKLGVPTGLTLHNSSLSPGQALSAPATATAVNMNSPTINLATNGQLTIQNVDPNVTTLSFSEQIPLITA